MVVVDNVRRVVVVGGSLAGLRTCESLRQRGYAEQIVLIGAEDHMPYDRPPLSKDFLAGAIDESRLALRDQAKIDALDIEFRLGTLAVDLDLEGHSLNCSDGRSVQYDCLVIATGATPRALPSFNHDSVFTVRTLDDSIALRRAITTPGCRLVVIGGGFLGMEVAATANTSGAAVTVVEPLEAPLARVLGATIGNALRTEHTEHGVEILTGIGAERSDGQGNVDRIVLDTGRVLEATAAVVAIGVVPETAWLEGSGLEIDNGVVCDASLYAAEGVYAAGDVARFPHQLAGGLVRIEHWTNATEQASHVAEMILAGEAHHRPFDAVPYFWSDHFDLKIQALGFPRHDDEAVFVDGSLASRRFVACYGRQGKLSGVVAFGRPRQLMAFRRLLIDGSSFEEALQLQVP